ncbi:O-fucosyltransferase 29 [Turnera subulata]|uniref:O-fucosyltransferase family protein n=1 Tax=Turnera subulata TaxID=218843 RepID=A0A9Q0G3I2_9ROSI|nr:O-fucosyltransferase 29 [Turnera subulata]
MRCLAKPPYTIRVPRKSPPKYYLDQVLPVLLRRHGVQLTKFHYRLANHLDGDIPKLRCRTTTWTGTFMKMRSMAKRYIAVHLRGLMCGILISS